MGAKEADQEEGTTIDSGSTLVFRKRKAETVDAKNRPLNELGRPPNEGES